MSEVNTGSGAPTPTSGAQGEPKSIKPEDHQKAIDDLMRFKKEAQETKAKLDELLRERQKVEEKKLADAGEYQKLLQIKEAESNDLKLKLKEREQNEESLRRTLFDAAKLNAVRERLPGQLHRPEYMNFIDIDKVAINPQTSEIDLQSVESVVQDFVKSHPHLLKTDPVRLPNGSPSAVMNLTYEQWTKLPLKERKARMAEVMKNSK